MFIFIILKTVLSTCSKMLSTRGLSWLSQPAQFPELSVPTACAQSPEQSSGTAHGAGVLHISCPPNITEPAPAGSLAHRPLNKYTCRMKYLHHQASGWSHPFSSSAHTQNNLGRTTLMSAFCLSSPQKASGRQLGNLQYCLSKFLLEINHSYRHLNTLKSPKQKSAFQWYDFQNGYIHCEAVKEK